MKLGEAVTLIVDTHGWDAFDDLKKLKRRDKSMKEAVKVVEEARKIRNVWQHRERKAPPTKEQIAKCIDEGLKMQEIARKLHRQDATIRSCVNRYGLRERYKKYHSLYAPSIVTVAECIEKDSPNYGEVRVFKSTNAADKGFGYKTGTVYSHTRKNGSAVIGAWKFTKKKGDIMDYVKEDDEI